MRFSLFTAALGLAASVSAATLNKRAVSAPVQQCITHLEAIDAEVLVLTTAISGFTSSSGYAGALNVHTTEQALEKLIATATTDCCAVTAATDEEADAVLAEVAVLVPHIVTALTTLNGKKSQFDAVLLADAIVDADIKSLKTKTTALDTCLYNAAPADKQSEAQGYIDTINNAFTTTYSTWGL